MRIKSFLLFIMTSWVVSCSQNDEIVVAILPEDKTIRVEASVEAIDLKAGLQTTNLNQFGLFITNASNESYCYSNVEMSKPSEIWVSSENMLWQSDSQPITVVVYSPYQSTASLDSEIEVSVMDDQTSDDNIEASDFLYASAEVTPSDPDYSNSIYYDKEDQVLNIGMSHRFTKLNIIISLTSYDVTTNSISSICITGTNTLANLNLATNTLSDLSQILPITPYYNGAELQTTTLNENYECVIIPQTILKGDLGLTMTIDGSIYSWSNSSDIPFEPEKEYSLEISVSNNTVSASTVACGDWIISTNESNVETE